jgi:hypothetical protein
MGRDLKHKTVDAGMKDIAMNSTPIVVFTIAGHLR